MRGRILLLMASEGPPGLRGMDGKTQEGLTDPGWSVTPAVGSSFPIAGEKMGLCLDRAAWSRDALGW